MLRWNKKGSLPRKEEASSRREKTGLVADGRRLGYQRKEHDVPLAERKGHEEEVEYPSRSPEIELSGCSRESQVFGSISVNPINIERLAGGEEKREGKYAS